MDTALKFIRRAHHAGSWYSMSEIKLNEEL